MAHPKFQIMSDLHLETPLNQKSYRKFEMNIEAEFLCLLGDIGLVQDSDLFWFLENLLKQYPSLKIFYVIGNHEPYQTSLEIACSTMRAFEERISRSYGHRFIFLNRTRYDISPTLTVLGCTLWTYISDEQAHDVWNILADFNPTRGIRDWDVLGHREEHSEDLAWLNEQVSTIAQEDRERQIIILTHHSPTLDPRLNDPRHKDSNVRSGFVTDLSNEVCWKAGNVRCWAFGHTHYSGYYHEESTNKLVYSNQRGYSSFGAAKQPVVKGQVVKAGGEIWEVAEGFVSSGVRVPPIRKQTHTGVQPKIARSNKKVEEAKPQGLMGKLRKWLK